MGKFEIRGEVAREKEWRDGERDDGRERVMEVNSYGGREGGGEREWE